MKKPHLLGLHQEELGPLDLHDELEDVVVFDERVFVDDDVEGVGRLELELEAGKGEVDLGVAVFLLLDQELEFGRDVGDFRHADLFEAFLEVGVETKNGDNLVNFTDLGVKNNKIPARRKIREKRACKTPLQKSKRS